MAQALSHESKQPEEIQETIDEVERAQVAKRWTHVMMRYGVEARGQRFYTVVVGPVSCQVTKD